MKCCKTCGNCHKRRYYRNRSWIYGGITTLKLYFKDLMNCVHCKFHNLSGWRNRGYFD